MKNIFDFLKQLCVNNNREWFDSNRGTYKSVKSEFENYVQQLIDAVSSFDSSIKDITPKHCVFRINRDTRFSNDKTPYKTNFGAFINPGGKSLFHAGYYLHIEPDNSFVSGGIYLPPSPILLNIRTAIYNNPSGFLEIIENVAFKKEFGKIEADVLKTAPKGFPRDFEHIDLLKFKSFTVSHMLSDEFIENGDVVSKAIESFKLLRDFNTFLNKAIID